MNMDLNYYYYYYYYYDYYFVELIWKFAKVAARLTARPSQRERRRAGSEEGSERAKREEREARARERKRKKPVPPRTREKQSILQVHIVISFGLFCDDLLLPVNVFFAFEKFPYFFSAFSLFFPPPGGGSGIADVGLKSDAFGCVFSSLSLCLSHSIQFQYQFVASFSSLCCLMRKSFCNPYYSHLPCIAFPCCLLVPFVSPVIFFVFIFPPLWFPPLTQSIFHFGLSTYSCSCFLSMY